MWPPLRLARLRCERESVAVVCPALLQFPTTDGDGVRGMRCIGLDVHQRFCVVAICQDGGEVRLAGRVETSREQLELFAASLARTDRVVLEATGAAFAIARILAPHVG